MLLVPKAGLEPARISTVDFESTASTDFATSALKRYAENVEDYTVTPDPRNPNPPRCDLSAEKNSATRRSITPRFLPIPPPHSIPHQHNPANSAKVRTKHHQTMPTPNPGTAAQPKHHRTRTNRGHP